MYKLQWVSLLVVLGHVTQILDAMHTNAGAVMQLNSTQTFCSIQSLNCGKDLHPLCKDLPKIYETEFADKLGILELSKLDKAFILIEINKFRNKLAGGYIPSFLAGSDINLVKWSKNFEKLAVASEKFNSICTRISLNDTEFVDHISLAEDELHDDPYFFRESLSIKITESFDHTIWDTLFRAEFNRIGCAWINDTVMETYRMVCYTNRRGPEIEVFSLNTSYSRGKSCTQCAGGDMGKCHKRFKNLCYHEPNHITDIDEENENLDIDYEYDNNDVHKKDNQQEENPETKSHFIIYIIIAGLTIVAVIVIVAIIFLYCLIKDRVRERGQSYVIKHAGTQRNDLFADIE